MNRSTTPVRHKSVSSKPIRLLPVTYYTGVPAGRSAGGLCQDIAGMLHASFCAQQFISREWAAELERPAFDLPAQPAGKHTEYLLVFELHSRE